MDIVQNSNFNCDYVPPSSVPYRIYLEFNLFLFIVTLISCYGCYRKRAFSEYRLIAVLFVCLLIL
jgi:hypothetical protein